MTKNLFLSIGALTLMSASSALLAQDYAYHPELSDSFTVTLGAMRSNNSFRVEADVGDDIGDKIDFGDTLGVSNHSTFFNGQAKWKFGSDNKWSFAAQYFSNSAKGSIVLEEDIEWDGDTFKEGSFVESGVKLSVARLFFGRSIIKNDRNDFGVGAGLHNLKMTVFVEGEVLFNDETTGFQRAEVSASQILPNVGAWYNFSPARKWLLHGRVDWIGASIGDYDGHMWNMNAGVNYQAFDHIGFDVSWQYFNLNVNVDSDDWTGGADMKYSGPVLSITGNW
ncbi:hypothetical protein ACFL1C_01200 [Pseudomonadota bacterium]